MKWPIFCLLIICFFGIVFPIDVSSISNGQQQNDSLRDVSHIINQLDSLSKNDLTIEIDDGSERFKLFRSLLIIRNEEKFIDIIKTHANPVLRGYAYMALEIYGKHALADSIYKPYHKKLRICWGDVCWIYEDGSADKFISYVHSKLKRLKLILSNQNNTNDVLESEIIREENKIRKEQGITPLPEPK